MGKKIVLSFLRLLVRKPDRVQSFNFGFRVWGLGFRVQVQGLGFRVHVSKGRTHLYTSPFIPPYACSLIEGLFPEFPFPPLIPPPPPLPPPLYTLLIPPLYPPPPPQNPKL